MNTMKIQGHIETMRVALAAICSDVENDATKTSQCECCGLVKHEHYEATQIYRTMLAIGSRLDKAEATIEKLEG